MFFFVLKVQTNMKILCKMMNTYKVPRWTGPGRRAGPRGPGPLARGPGPARLPGPVHRPTNKNLRSFSSFFLKNDPLGKSWKNDFSGIPWNRGPSGPSLCSRAPNSIQDSLNESSVRPNGTPVMRVLRSRSNVKKTVRKKTWSGGSKNTVRIKGKSQLVLFVSDSNKNRIRMESSFYPDGVC